MPIYQKIAQITAALEGVEKDVTGNEATWVSDAAIKAALRPLLIKHKVMVRLIDTIITPLRDDRIVECTFEYRDIEDDSTCYTKISYEIGSVDLTGSAITLCSKYANINTFFIETYEDKSTKPFKGVEPVKVASPKEKAQQRVEDAHEKTIEAIKDKPKGLTAAWFKTKMNPEHYKAYTKSALLLGNNISQCHIIKMLPFSVSDLFANSTNTIYQQLYVAYKAGLLDKYMEEGYNKIVGKDYEPVYIPDDSSYFDSFSYYNPDNSMEKFERHIPTINERANPEIFSILKNYIENTLKIDVPKMVSQLKSLRNAQVMDYTYEEWLQSAQPREIDYAINEYAKNFAI